MRLPDRGFLVSHRLAEPAPAGWGVFRLEGDRARWVREASPWERPRELRRLVLLGQDARERWWGCPAGPTPGYPVRVRLVEGASELGQVLAWFDGDHHWQVEVLDEGSLARERLRAGIARRGEREVGRAASRIRRVADPGERLQRALGLAQARLLDWRALPDGFRVTWSRGTARVTSVVGQDLGVRDAGFCMAGTDRVHDLTSLASLLEERPT